ncbi:DUF5682 family protein [Streptomyces geranii]|uniref:DUF5682 family protein n=1 Tax=Streptomyces geranii TaxID=2058923 RepID=UPI0018E558A7|nr:DUF5682 family protein [Streptomyces geranii]
MYGTREEPRAAVAALTDSVRPFLLGVRHHSPALAAAVPALLDAFGAEVVCVELPADFQPWLVHLAAPGTVAPVALAGARVDGRLGFYPFADFSPELAAVRWARDHGVEVLCCDLPLADPGWGAGDSGQAGAPLTAFADALAAAGTGRDGDDLWDRAVEVHAPGSTPEAIRRAALGVGWALRQDAGASGGVAETDLAREAHMRRVLTSAAMSGRRVAAVVGAFHAPALVGVGAGAGFGEGASLAGGASSGGALVVSGVGEVPGSGGFGVAGGGESASPAGGASSGGGLVVPGTRESPGSGAFGVAGGGEGASLAGGDSAGGSGELPGSGSFGVGGGGDGVSPGDGASAGVGGLVPYGPEGARFGAPGVGGPSGGVGAGGSADGGSGVVTSFVPYAFDLLDSRSGYPAGIRDPQWQQAVFLAAGDAGRVVDAAARAVTDVCRRLRVAGHTAGTGEAAEALRLAGDLARLRGLPAPGRGELIEALTTVLGQGEPLGRGRALARAVEGVLVGSGWGRVAPGTPRSGLGPAVEAELDALRLPGPGDPGPREVRLDPHRSKLDRRREVLLQRLAVCQVGYGEAVEVAGTGDGAALTTRWKLAWTPAVPVRLDLAGVRGVTVALAAEGTLRAAHRHEDAATCAQVIDGLRAAARCDLPALVAEYLADAAVLLPSAATLPELLDALDLLEALRLGHLPGTTAGGREQATELGDTLLEAAVRALPGLAGSDKAEDAAALIALAARAGEHRLGLRMDDALGTLARTGSPLVQGAALAARVLLDLDDTDTLGTRAAGWIDLATDPDGRRRLTRLLVGLLGAAAPLLQSAPAALDPLLDRIEALADRDFLDRLPALRGGFDTLTPAGRGRLLDTVTERLGDRLDLTLDAPPELLALWTEADAAGLAALNALRLPVPEALTGAAASVAEPEPEPEPEAAVVGAEVAVASAVVALGAGAVAGAGVAPGGASSVVRDAVPAARLAPADRWRLLLGRETDRLPGFARRYAHALDELYGAGRGEGSVDLGRDGGGSGSGGGGGQEASFPSAREWGAELDALFGAEVREEVLARAAEHGRTDVLAELDPAAVRPSVELLTSVLSLAGGMPERQLARLRPLVRRLVDELAKELATRLRPALTGLATPRPTRRPGGRLDLPRTLRANLVHTRRLDDGRTVVVPERPVFSTRSRREADWRLILVVDVSGSMEASVIWSALTAAVLGGVPTLSTHFLAFSTSVIDLTDKVDDPLSLLLEVQVGGGTHIAAGLAHARSLVTVPSRTIVAVVSDFEEGYPLGGLLGEVRALAASGVHLMGCAALDDSGAPRYSVPVAQQLVAAGMPVAALSPLALARWVGDRLRGEPR